MNARPGALTLAAALSLIAASPAIADPSGCGDARAAWRSALETLTAALQDYTACLKSNHGQDDCAVAFVNVEAAQKDIEAAVADIQDDCQ